MNYFCMEWPSQPELLARPLAAAVARVCADARADDVREEINGKQLIMLTTGLRKLKHVRTAIDERNDDTWRSIARRVLDAANAAETRGLARWSCGGAWKGGARNTVRSRLESYGQSVEEGERTAGGVPETAALLAANLAHVPQLRDALDDDAR